MGSCKKLAWAGPVTEIEIFRKGRVARRDLGKRVSSVDWAHIWRGPKISMIGVKIFPYEHSSLGDWDNFFAKIASLSQHSGQSDIACIFTSKVYELKLLAKLQGSTKLRAVLNDTTSFRSTILVLFLGFHPGQPKWNYPYEHDRATKSVLVTKPVRLLGSYEEALN